MPDITRLILSDHTWFRWQFAALDDLQAGQPVDVDAVTKLWEPLSQRLDLHAIAEEEIFYPQLLERGADPEEETLDAIKDHNDIRDGLHDANRHPVASAEWWAAVRRARVANDEHMGEEENEGLADFRLHASAELRESLGTRFAEFLDSHPTIRGADTENADTENADTENADTENKDPEGYVRAVERELDPPRDGATGGGTSLGIGSLKGAR